MQLWATFFVISLGMIELHQWLQGVTLPLPALIVAGVLLAIASNRNKPAGLPWQNPSQQPFTKPSQPKPLQTSVSQSSSQNPQSSVPSPHPSQPKPPASNLQAPTPRPAPQLPNLTSAKVLPQPSISFTIRKPKQNS